METQRDRLFVFIASLGCSVREFERLLGVSNGTIRHLNDTLSANIKERVATVFPQLNMDWLLLGCGNMLNNSATGDGSMQNIIGSNNTNGVPQKKFANENKWFELVAEKDKQISALLQEMKEQRENFMELLKKRN